MQLARLQDEHGDRLAGAATGQIELQTFDSPRDIEREWRILERTGVGTVFQRFDWVDAFVANVSARDGSKPVIILGRIDGRPAFVLPMCVQRRGSTRIAEWIGGSHAGYNFGLWSREAMEIVGAMRERDLVARLKAALPGVDGLLLRRMPRTHQGDVLPLARLADRNSVVSGYSTDLAGGMDAVIARTRGGARRRRARTKEKRMSEMGPVSVRSLTEMHDIDRALAFFAQEKPRRLAEQGLPNVFGEPGIMDFLRDMAQRATGQAEPVFRLSTISVGDEIRALVGAGVHQATVNLFVLTYARDETLPHSPGQVLMYRLIEESCARQQRRFDFGVGFETYKESWRDTVIQLADGYVPFTVRGSAVLGAARATDAVKDRLRGNDTLRALLRRLRRRSAADEGHDEA